MSSISTKLWSGKTIWLISLSFIVFNQYATAQVEQLQRYETLLSENEPPFEVTTARHNGLFLHRYLSAPNNDIIEITRLDTAFRKLWSGFVPLDKGLILAGRKTADSLLYFLLKHQNSKNFELIRMNQDNGNYSQYTIKSFIPFNVTEFQITSEAALIGGYYNRVPLVLYYNLATHVSKVLPGLFNEEGELTQVQSFKDGTFQVLISAKNLEKQKTIWIKNYHSDGTLINNLVLRPEERKNLLFGRSVRTANGMEVIAGIYGHARSEYSRGLFIATIDPNGLQQIRYYNFGDLQNFFKYLKARRENRIKERIERRKIKGKKIKFNYRFLVHEVIERNGQYVMLGEAFYPLYKSLSGSSYNGFFQPYSYSGFIRGDQVFDGYRYTHAVIIGFDKDGKLLWDNSFEINDVKTYALEQFVRFEVRGDKIALLYLFDGQIRTKIIKDNNVLEEKYINPIKTRFEKDVALKEKNTASQLNYWYDEFFYAYGVQNIINASDPDVPPRRRVFFINKIGYR